MAVAGHPDAVDVDADPGRSPVHRRASRTVGLVVAVAVGVMVVGMDRVSARCLLRTVASTGRPDRARRW